jgi:ribosomal 30S subunit maturation factor RimM
MAVQVRNSSRHTQAHQQAAAAAKIVHAHNQKNLVKIELNTKSPVDLKNVKLWLEQKKKKKFQSVHRFLE